MVTVRRQSNGHSLRILTLFDKLLEHDSCQKAGKILSVSNMGSAINTPLAFTEEQRSHYWYMLKTAIIRSIDDMAEIVKSGDRKATTFLIGEIERLFDGQSLGLAERHRGGRSAAEPASPEPFI